jgi:hypothetical protein
MRSSAPSSSMPKTRRSSLKSPSRKQSGRRCVPLPPVWTGRQCHLTGSLIADDVKSAQRQREQKGSEVESAAAIDIVGSAQCRIASQCPRLRQGHRRGRGSGRRCQVDARRATWCPDRGLAETDRVETAGIEPLSLRIGNGSDHGRPSLSWRVLGRTIVAARMKPQRTQVVQVVGTARTQIRFGERAADRARDGQTSPAPLPAIRSAPLAEVAPRLLAGWNIVPSACRRQPGHCFSAYTTRSIGVDARARLVGAT